MAPDVLEQIAALARAQRLDDAIDLCRATLEGEATLKLRVQVAAALCLCLGGQQRLAEAADVYVRFRTELLAAGGDFHVPAAIAARHAQDIQDHFRAKSSFYRGQPVAFSILSTIDQWCERHGMPAMEIEPPRRVLVSDSEQYVTDSYRCYGIPSAEMISGWDFVITPDGHLLSDTGYMPLDTFFGVFPYAIAESLRVIAHVSPDECEVVPHEALFLSVPRAFHVGHFLVDFLPRLRCLAACKPDIKIAFPREAPVKFVDLLAQFGIPKERMILCDLGKRYRFKSLVVARPGDYLRPNPATIKFVRQALYKPAQRPATRRVFLERNVGTRLVANAAEFDALLTEMAFERVNLAEVPIAEQQAYFAQARIMVGVFGSDLLCCYFAPKGSDLIELTWDPGQPSVIRPTCQLLGIRHQFTTCPEAPEVQQKRYKKDLDIVVDCDALRRTLIEIISPKVT